MTNREYLKQSGFVFTGDTNTDNYNINNQYNIESEESIVTMYKGGGSIPLIANISRKNYQFAFQNDIWKTLSVPQKLRVLKWQEVDYLHERGYKGAYPKFSFVSDFEYDNMSYSALAKNGEIEFNLEYLEKCTGYNALATIVHESIHEIDFENFGELVLKYIPEYFAYSDVNRGYVTENIIKLPLEGKIFNRITGKYDYVSEVMREDFLLIKNLCIRINSYKNTPKSKKQVYDKNSYERYMRAMFYVATPLEERAFEGSCQYAVWVAGKNQNLGHVPSAEDMKATSDNYRRIKFLKGKKREIQKAYKVPVWKAVNLELINEFNHMVFGDDKTKYICKKQMMDREMYRINFYYAKFKANELSRF